MCCLFQPSGVRSSHYFATKTRRKFDEHVHFLKSFEGYREVGLSVVPPITVEGCVCACVYVSECVCVCV